MAERHASVAQSVVHLTRNEKVACSSQVTSSKKPTRQGWLFALRKGFLSSNKSQPRGLALRFKRDDQIPS